jgi:signal-transduction protein with cAMP-binding, CBS, and nucleotidyltransferase domain
MLAVYSEMSDKDRAMLATKVDVVTVAPGSSVYKQGHVGKCFYVVVQGAVEELFEYTNCETGVKTCEPGPVYLAGQFFGEQALVTESHYPSTMTCIGMILPAVPVVRPTSVLRHRDDVQKRAYYCQSIKMPTGASSWASNEFPR